MKYTLNCYGWSAEFIGKSLSNDEVERIEKLKEEKGAEELWEVRWDIDDKMEMDIWDGDLLHINKPLSPDSVHYELVDESGQVILTMNAEDISVNELLGANYELFPTECCPIYFSVDENKGGIFSYEFESDTTPTLEDFTLYLGIVDTPQAYFDIIDAILFRGEMLEIVDFLDSTGKSSELYIFKEDQIN